MRINGLEFTAVEGDLTCRDCHLDKCGSCKDVLCTDGERASIGKKGCIYVVDGDIKDLIKPKYSGLDLNIELARAILGWVNSGEVDVSRFASVLIARYSLSLSISSDPKSRDLSPMDLVERILSATQSGSNLTEIIRWVDHYIFVENHPLVEDAEEVAVKYLLKNTP